MSSKRAQMPNCGIMDVYEQSMHGGNVSKDETRMTIRLPRDLLEAAKSKAQADDVTVSQAVRWFLRAWIQDELSPTLSFSEQESKPQEAG